MKKLLIFGSGDLAKIVFFEVMQEKKFNVLGFIDQYKQENLPIIKYKKKKI